MELNFIHAKPKVSFITNKWSSVQTSLITRHLLQSFKDWLELLTTKNKDDEGKPPSPKARMHTHMHVHMQTHMHARMRAHIYSSMHTHTHTHTLTRTCTRTHTHTHKNTHTLMHTHTHTHTHKVSTVA